MEAQLSSYTVTFFFWNGQTYDNRENEEASATFHLSRKSNDHKWPPIPSVSAPQLESLIVEDLFLGEHPLPSSKSNGFKARSNCSERTEQKYVDFKGASERRKNVPRVPAPRSWDGERHEWSLSHTTGTVGTLDSCGVNLSPPDFPVLRRWALHIFPNLLNTPRSQRSRPRFHQIESEPHLATMPVSSEAVGCKVVDPNPPW
ncbi:hypothetical protein B0T13DRAFT_500498 [Neurospora crassa]|nr:hypothetical protein B0T13DRAFT_500498 [Neurospora crassa]